MLVSKHLLIWSCWGLIFFLLWRNSLRRLIEVGELSCCIMVRERSCLASSNSLVDFTSFSHQGMHLFIIITKLPLILCYLCEVLIFIDIDIYYVLGIFVIGCCVWSTEAVLSACASIWWLILLRRQVVRFLHISQRPKQRILVMIVFLSKYIRRYRSLFSALRDLFTFVKVLIVWARHNRMYLGWFIAELSFLIL